MQKEERTFIRPEEIFSITGEQVTMISAHAKQQGGCIGHRNSINEILRNVVNEQQITIPERVLPTPDIVKEE